MTDVLCLHGLPLPMDAQGLVIHPGEGRRLNPADVGYKCVMFCAGGATCNQSLQQTRERIADLERRKSESNQKVLAPAHSEVH